MKKFFALILVTFMMLTMFVACGDEVKNAKAGTNDVKISEIKAAVEEFMGELVSSNIDADALVDRLCENELGKSLSEVEIKALKKDAEKVAEVMKNSFSITVSDIEVNGDTATAKVTMTGPDMENAEIDMESLLNNSIINEIDADSTAYDIFAVVLDKLPEIIESIEKIEETGVFSLEFKRGKWEVIL